MTIDIDDERDALRVVDAVTNAVFTPSRAPLSRERRTQLGTDTKRVVGQRTEQELDTGCGHCFGKPLGQLPCSSPGDDDPKAHTVAADVESSADHF